MTTGVSEAQILEELQALREAVSALQAARDMHPRVRLHATPERPFLGQPVTITATVTREHLASIGVPVTLYDALGTLTRHCRLSHRAGEYCHDAHRSGWLCQHHAATADFRGDVA